MEPLRVLIIEDVEDDAILTLRELRRGGYDVMHHRVDTVETLREAIETQVWDLAISDFSLPTMTAMDALAVLTSSGLDLPCIVISGTIDEEAAVDAMKSGAADFVSKIRMARLLPAVSRELREAAERRQRREAEAALNEAKNRMRFALEAAGVGTWESDLVRGTTIWSDVLERLHGLETGTFGGTLDAFMAAVHLDDRQTVRDSLAKARRDRTESHFEYRTVWPDGSEHWITGVGQTFYDEGGRPIRAAGIGMDVTAQRSLEDQFRQAQRMESIGNLAGGIAHDFNNLLTAILGYSSFLLEELPVDAARASMRNDLEEIRSAGTRAAALTGQLLAFSRRQILQLKALNVNAVIESLAPMLHRVIGEDIALVSRLAHDLGTAKADVGQLEQVIMNLVVNARDAMVRGGRITLGTANVVLDEVQAQTHLSLAPGRYIALTVSDTGCGMPPDVQARIFEPFFTTKPKGRGTGLGLATIYGIVKQLDGDVLVESAPDQGTTFTVYLPRVNEAPERLTTHVAPGPNVKGDETVLVVEDDDRLRKLSREVLRRSGYTVIEAGEAEEAMRVATTYDGPIHLLLTDVVMPGDSGQVLAQRLTLKRPQVKVLYMSGYTDDAIVHHGVLMPGVAFLQKPFVPATLARAVRDVLDGGEVDVGSRP